MIVSCRKRKEKMDIIITYYFLLNELNTTFIFRVIIANIEFFKKEPTSHVH